MRGILLKIESFLKLFIDDLEKAVGPLYYDDDNAFDDPVRLELEDIPNIIIEVAPTLEYMNVYRVFSYYSYSRSIREKLDDKEELENDIYQFFEQQEYEKYLRQLPFTIDTNIEDCWGCPCYDVYVGITNVQCDVNLAKKFIELTRTFDSLDAPRDLNAFKTRKLNEILQRFGTNISSSQISIIVRDPIDYKPLSNDKTIVHCGSEYVLIRNEELNAAIPKYLYDIFLCILNEIEFFSDYTIEITPFQVKFITCSFIIEMLQSDEKLAISTETVLFNSNLSNLILFLPKENRELLSKTISESLSDDDTSKYMHRYFSPHIYTEGQTDCMHIKHAFELSPISNREVWYFDEALLHDKGDKQLQKLCETLSRCSDSSHAKIAIFDRDGSIPLEDIEDEKKGYRDWGNRVYSIALPLPQHRISTPRISIEHYYSNEEIFFEHKISGINRRLYMGNEFDRTGLALQIGKKTKNRNKCGPDSIAIIDCDVYDFDDSTETNYALSKMKFAESMCALANISIEATQAFALLFSKISKIIRDDNDWYGKNK